MTTEPKADAVGPEAKSLSALDRLKEQFLARWDTFPDDAETALDDLLEQALAQARVAEPEVITVMNPVSRPHAISASDRSRQRPSAASFIAVSITWSGMSAFLTITAPATHPTLNTFGRGYVRSQEVLGG